MASQVFDVTALDNFARQMQQTSSSFQRRQKTFLRKEGSKLRSQTKKQARTVKRKTGNYLKSIRRGKVYSYDGALAVRVYSYAPHAHLVEEGHRMVTHDGREVGFVLGHHVFEIAGSAFAPQFVQDIDQMLDEVVNVL